MQELWFYFVFCLVLITWLQFSEKTLIELLFNKISRLVLSSSYLTVMARAKWKSCTLLSSFDRTLNSHFITEGKHLEPAITGVQNQN